MSDAEPTASELLIAVTRLEAKIDVVLAQHTADLKEHGRDISDHEQRIRALEAKPTVAPRVLWTVTVSALTLLCAIVGTVLAVIL